MTLRAFRTVVSALLVALSLGAGASCHSTTGGTGSPDGAVDTSAPDGAGGAAAPDGAGGTAAPDSGATTCDGPCVAAATCSDGVKNGMETDIDCGGPMCAPCSPGLKCLGNSDCQGNACQGTCQCPSGMLVVPIQGSGGLYCIDAVEVTYGAYNAFYNANPPTAGQSAFCSWNQGWTPSGAWPYLPASVDVPVTFVNWCQAQAYCKYQGRHLCGKIGNGAGASPLSSFNDFRSDQWFNACSAQGLNCPSSAGAVCYPYGTSYAAMLCNGANSNPGPEAWNVLTACQGGELSLLNMSGNVAEWEDSCSGATGKNDSCAVRGGSYKDDAAHLRCDSGQPAANGPVTQPRSYMGPDVGFRCCL